ncbi:MAG TPA: glycosyl hydrolase family 28-related protein, partial [Burkholderiaceae bacterium]|nr:glycosyl hydrolase family 28-related protein [Burkholderiaceae bacterium]
MLTIATMCRAMAADCTALPPAPKPPADARSVTEFGATPNDDRDDTEAIQKAFDSVRPGQWLVFPPGRYLHSKALWLRKPGVVLWGEGATLHATNTEDQAILLAADNTSIYNFTLTAETDKRLAAPWQSRIAVFDRVDRFEPLRNNIVRGNRIVSSGDPRTSTANSASSAGIFVYRAQNFLVAENLVTRSLSDAIHVTGGSRDGRVLNNLVRENGDDMIAIVSYLGDGPWTDASISDEAAQLDRKRETHLVRNIVVAHNDVAGQYWGRGISVVGGENVTIRENTISDTTHGAAIYIAREPSYLTFGVRNVKIENNTIRNVQTTDPKYTVRAPVKTKHAAVEIYSRLLSDETEIPKLVDALTVEGVMVSNNTIDSVISDAIRAPGRGEKSVLTGKRRDGMPIVK